MFSRFRQLFLKEFLELFRDPRMRVLTFIFPALQIIILAQAFVLELRNVDLAVIDHDNSVLSRELVAEISASGHFNAKFFLQNVSAAEKLLDSEAVRAIIEIPAGFAGASRRESGGQVALYTDGTATNDAGLIQAYVANIVSGFLQKKNLSENAPIVARSWFNANLESRFYFVPGLIAIQLVVVSFLLASIAIVKEKEIGTIEQLMVTPITSAEFILGKTLPYMAIGYIAATIMLLVSFGFYGIMVKGSWLILYLSVGVFLAGNLGGALLISVVSTTQQQALLTSFFFMLPLVMLSGLLFPIRNMPEIIQYLTLANPLRWFLQILNGIISRGCGLEELWFPVLVQVLLAAVFISIAIRSFHKASD